ncbi:co-chaperone YbbN [Nesterenkonia alkaliphila]|uniref:Tetratricopeptide repeat protein n=1 Tax=Nesterenkonia alkaliphila TaxID=1463631 RepID=A0A7K1UFZ8_9MICC|nr:tetratricopeptide repeat protein [Nesterenkonia alkaliphila]MVT25352.1 tetratricopeptide repeat protein [Nesterenkonia alkaliphila]GFZ94369.1 thioredoxin [Nesterenkonia alkaliphila]
MSENPSANQRTVNAHGAVDLSALAEGSGQQPAASGSRPGGQDSWTAAVAPQQLQQIVQLSAQVPALVLIHGEDAVSQQFQSALQRAVDAQRGRIVLATIDAAASPELAQQAGKLPVVTAFLSGQPIAEFDSSAPVEQLPQVVTQILQLATQNGITGTVKPLATTAGEQDAEAEPEVPPLHQKAHQALEQGDYDAAVAAFEQAVKENPGDSEAKLGIAQVRLMKRTHGADLAAVRQRAAENPDDVQAQTDVADIDVLGGHVEDAFNRLIRYIQSHFGDDRETARKHLVELFSIVGDSDPRVAAARKKLATALF